MKPLEISRGAYQFVEAFSTADSLPQQLSVALHAVMPEGHPDLQGLKTPRHLGSVFEVIEPGVLGRRCTAQVGGRQRRSPVELLGFAHEQAAALIGYEKPLVGSKVTESARSSPVYIAFFSGSMAPTAPACSICMEPQPIPFTDISDLIQRIDGAGVDRAYLRHDAKGAIPTGQVCPDHRFKRLGFHGEICPARYSPDGAAPQIEQVCRPLYRDVTFVIGHVNQIFPAASLAL